MRRVVRWLAIVANLGWLVNVARFSMGNAQVTGTRLEMDGLGFGIGTIFVFAVNAFPALLAVVALTWFEIRQPK
jgi:hypothetical protein